MVVSFVEVALASDAVRLRGSVACMFTFNMDMARNFARHAEVLPFFYSYIHIVPSVITICYRTSPLVRSCLISRLSYTIKWIYHPFESIILARNPGLESIPRFNFELPTKTRNIL